jgi:hypothetical protein
MTKLIGTIRDYVKAPKNCHISKAKQNKAQLNSYKTPKYKHIYRVEPGYNDIGLYDTSSIASDILSYQLLAQC